MKEIDIVLSDVLFFNIRDILYNEIGKKLNFDLRTYVKKLIYSELNIELDIDLFYSLDL